MPAKSKAYQSHARIVVGLPDIQDQLRLVNRLAQGASDPDRGHLVSLGDLLSEFYAQLQHQKQVTVYRFGSKNRSRADVA